MIFVTLDHHFRQAVD